MIGTNGNLLLQTNQVYQQVLSWTLLLQFI